MCKEGAVFMFDFLKTSRPARPSAVAQRNRPLMHRLVMRGELNPGGEGDLTKGFGVRQSIQQVQEVYGSAPHPSKGGAV